MSSITKELISMQGKLLTKANTVEIIIGVKMKRELLFD